MSRFPLNIGVVGVVGATLKPLHIQEAHQCSYFDRSADVETGYRTRNVLCVPTFDADNELTGVIQVHARTHTRIAAMIIC